ncbi:MAG: hypothetical protein A4E30_00138 [Methanomassiliicoccales archaeon PtaB.Bin215]|nr:MAG: hypothetical protein A4E30_00138 [Methanomassiliicoccales archaeon PtaB.Bin215]
MLGAELRDVNGRVVRQVGDPDVDVLMVHMGGQDLSRNAQGRDGTLKDLLRQLRADLVQPVEGDAERSGAGVEVLDLPDP